jgi:hypothetical protein
LDEITWIEEEEETEEESLRGIIGLEDYMD